MNVRSRVLFAWIAVVVTLGLLACDVASFIPKQAGSDAPAAIATAVAGVSSAASSSASSKSAPISQDASSRIGDSLNRLLLVEQKTLDSYHMEASGTEPEWNSQASKIGTSTFTMKADVAGDNIHFIQTKKGVKEETTEAYIIGASSKDGGKGYAVENGKLREGLFIPLTWAMLPLDYGLPLIYGSMGPTARGDEAVDGRTAEKFDLDSEKAPTGAKGMLSGFGLNVYTAKGTAWVDKAKGALLKMNMDYERDVNDMQSGNKTMGKGNGHIEIVVTQVGKVSVVLPNLPAASSGPLGGIPTQPASSSSASSRAAAATPTKAPAGKPTATPTTPAPVTAKVNQRVTMQGLAFTITKVETSDKGAASGSTWVIAHLNVENVGSEDTSIYLDSFAYVDKAGNEYDELVNQPSAPAAYSKDVLDYTELAPGEKITNKLLLIQMKKTQVPGLKLRWVYDDENVISWTLGL